jgi:flagellar biosynthesis protein FlhF
MTHNTDSLHPQAQIKRFVAPTMRRALDLVRQDMGAEAVILSSRKVDGGIEVITSLEPDLSTRGVDTRRSFGQNFDSEYDTAMSSDSAWRSQAGIEQAVASYAGQSYGSSERSGSDSYAVEKHASEHTHSTL